MFEALNPRGRRHAVRLRPLCDRPSTLGGHPGLRIGWINSWPTDSGFETLQRAVLDYASKRHGTATPVVLNKPTAYSLDDPPFWDRVVAECDAFVYATAPSASTTHYGIHHAAGLEMRGRPGVVLVFDTLERDAANSVEGVGMAMRFVRVPYPLDRLTGGELDALAAKVVEELLAPCRSFERLDLLREPPQVPRIACHGDYADVQNHFYDSGWTDGLPIAPPTEDAVARMLAATSHAPVTIVTDAMGPEGWAASVEAVAINAVMAGCTPECLPIVLAAVEAFSTGYNGLRSAYSTPARATNSFSFMQVVNGPVRHEARMNSGLAALGPGNRANASIGRALRLCITNLGGSELGANTLPVQGNPSAYSFAFAENEEASPWPSFAVQSGFAAEDSVLTLMVGGWSHVGNYISEGLERLASDIASLEYPSGIALLLSPARARMLATQGMDKQAVEDFVWSRAVMPAARFRSGNYWTTLIEPNLRLDDARRRLWPIDYLTVPDVALIPVYPRSQFNAFVVGGEISPMMQAWKMQYPLSVSIDRWR